MISDSTNLAYLRSTSVNGQTDLIYCNGPGLPADCTGDLAIRMVTNQVPPDDEEIGFISIPSMKMVNGDDRIERAGVRVAVELEQNGALVGHGTIRKPPDRS